jgi:hypothetical protein
VKKNIFQRDKRRSSATTQQQIICGWRPFSFSNDEYINTVALLSG